MKFFSSFSAMVMPQGENTLIIHPLKKPVKLVSFDLDGVLDQFSGVRFEEMIELFQKLRDEFEVKTAITTTNAKILIWHNLVKAQRPELAALIDYWELYPWENRS